MVKLDISKRNLNFKARLTGIRNAREHFSNVRTGNISDRFSGDFFAGGPVVNDDEPMGLING